MTSPNKNDHDRKETSHVHAHDGWLNRLLGDRAELVFALMSGTCLLVGWLGPKLGLMPENAGFLLLLAAYGFGG